MIEARTKPAAAGAEVAIVFCNPCWLGPPDVADSLTRRCSRCGTTVYFSRASRELALSKARDVRCVCMTCVEPEDGRHFPAVARMSMGQVVEAHKAKRKIPRPLRFEDVLGRSRELKRLLARRIRNEE